MEINYVITNIKNKMGAFRDRSIEPPRVAPDDGSRRPPAPGPRVRTAPQDGARLRPFLLCTFSVRGVITHNFLFKGMVQLGK